LDGSSYVDVFRKDVFLFHFYGEVVLALGPIVSAAFTASSELYNPQPHQDHQTTHKLPADVISLPLVEIAGIRLRPECRTGILHKSSPLKFQGYANG